MARTCRRWRHGRLRTVAVLQIVLCMRHKRRRFGVPRSGGGGVKASAVLQLCHLLSLPLALQCSCRGPEGRGAAALHQSCRRTR